MQENFYIHHLTINSGFWDTFFPELFASIVTLIIGSFFIPKYLDWRKRPRLKIINPITRNNIFKMTKSEDDFQEATLKFVIKNEGATTQRERFWHLIVPTELNPSIISLDETIICQQNELVSGKQRWIHYFGNSQPKEAIYPGRALHFNYELKIKTSHKESKSYQIYYYFITEFGAWPKKATNIKEFLDDPKVIFGSDFLSSIIIENY